MRREDEDVRSAQKSTDVGALAEHAHALRRCSLDLGSERAVADHEERDPCRLRGAYRGHGILALVERTDPDRHCLRRGESRATRGRKTAPRGLL